MKKVLLGAALAALILVPTASARGSHRVKLAVVVLPKSALGTAGHKLAVDGDVSGVYTNDDEFGKAFSAKPNTFKRLGRITGYELSYGDPYSGASGVTAISTAVDEYKTSAGARRGLAFWQKDDPKITALVPYGLPLEVKALKPAKVGANRFAYVSTYSVPDAVPVSFIDEQFTDGRYVLEVVTASSSVSTASHAAAKYAHALDHRLRLAEAGHLRGKPVKLPPSLKAGPPSNGAGPRDARSDARGSRRPGDGRESRLRTAGRAGALRVHAGHGACGHLRRPDTGHQLVPERQ